MDKVKRIYVEKKPAYAVAAGELFESIKSYLSISSVKAVRIFNRYDIENISQAVYDKAKNTVFSEPPVDYLYEEQLPEHEGAFVFSVEYLPGQ